MDFELKTRTRTFALITLLGFLFTSQSAYCGAVVSALQLVRKMYEKAPALVGPLIREEEVIFGRAYAFTRGKGMAHTFIYHSRDSARHLEIEIYEGPGAYKAFFDLKDPGAAISASNQETPYVYLNFQEALKVRLDRVIGSSRVGLDGTGDRGYFVRTMSGLDPTNKRVSFDLGDLEETRVHTAFQEATAIGRIYLREGPAGLERLLSNQRLLEDDVLDFLP